MVYALVVIYNKLCEDSESLSYLQSESDMIRIIVFDNSTISNTNQEWCAKRGYRYYSRGNNIGLSKAYNIVLNDLEKSNEDYIMILDDDTILSENYFREVHNCVKSHKYHILLPIVMSGDLMMSPCKMVFGCKPTKLNNKNNIDKTKVSAINSGMVVRLDVYEKISYDENMFLDCVDHDFMNQCRRLCMTIHILESEIRQNYSLNSKVSRESTAFRFDIQKKDLKVYYKKYKHIFIYYMYEMWLSLKLAIKYHSFEFLYRALFNISNE